MALADPFAVAADLFDPPADAHVLPNDYVPHAPHPAQAEFLELNVQEALYGGAAGGGKSDALLMAALRYVTVPGYAALLLRKTYADLALPGAIMDRSKTWLAGTAARWSDIDKRWTFPSGATLNFGYLQSARDKFRYQSAEFQFVGFDELTQFDEADYLYLFSRLRRPSAGPLARVPLRMRSASNPGGRGHEWVKGRFGIYRPEGDEDDRPLYVREDWEPTRAFIPAKLTDNPHVDQAEYERSLAALDHHTRTQLRDGDWDNRPPGDLFRRDWFEIVDEAPAGCRWIRFWDLAATEPSDANPDPDWTVGLRLGRHPNGTFFVEHVERLRKRPQGVETAVQAMAARDGKGTGIRVEQEPGSSGVNTVDSYQRLLVDRELRGVRSTGPKAERARVVSAKAEHGLVKLVRGSWNAALLDELEAFTETDDHAHDDQVDALSGAYAQLVGAAGGAATQSRLQQAAEPVVKHGDLVLRGERYVDQK